MDHRRPRGRTSNRARPNHLRGRSGRSRFPLDTIIDDGARDVLAEGNPLAAEAWASHLVGVLDTVRFQARLAGQEVPPFEEVILQRCAERRDQPALTVATTLTAVLPPPLGEQARRVTAGLRQCTDGPAWLAEVGRGEPTRAWLVTDVFGDQDALIVGFTHPGAACDHAIVALVDHNLSGQAKDVWLGDDLEGVVAEWSAHCDSHMRVERAPIDVALGRLRDAMAASDLWSADAELRSEDFADHRALVWARLHTAGHGDRRQPDVGKVSQEEREAVVAEFLASRHGLGVRATLGENGDTREWAENRGNDVELLAHSLVALRCEYEGRPLRWSPTVAAMLLADLAPRALLLHPEQALALPAVLRAFVRFAGERAGLEPAFIEEILTTVDEAEPAFLESVRRPGAALRDPRVALPQPPHRPRRARRPHPPAELVATTEAVPALDRFATLVGFYGDGRKLTATGQPTLADARALVSLLDTDDRIDETIGDRTFKTRSAADLPELVFTIRWAIAAGALRKEQGRLRATAAWRKLDGKPVERWLKAAEALGGLGPLAGFYVHARSGFRQMAELVDELVPLLLHSLRAAPMAFEAALDVISGEADELYEWTAGYWADPDARRDSFRHDLDKLLRILGWAGIVQRVGATLEPDPWIPKRERLVGGSLELTPLATWWLGGP